MSANTYLMDVLTRHQVFVQRFADGETDKVLELLHALRNQLAGEIAAQPSTEFQIIRTYRLYTFVNAAIAGTMDQIENMIGESMSSFADYEAEFMLKAIQPVIDSEVILPAPQMIQAAVSNPVVSLVTGDQVEQKTFNQIIREFAGTKQQEIRTLIQTGIISGKPMQEISRDIARKMDTAITRQIGAIVRTTTNAVATSARQSTLSANADVLTGVKWVSTLDGRTSDVCMGRDQKEYPLDSGPRPPAHFNCRSTVVPIVDPRFTVPIKGGTRASADGPVDARTTYNSWLGRQSAGFQDEVLGETRAKLFREGGLHVSKFTNDAGITYNLDQLRQLEPLAFERAGL